MDYLKIALEILDILNKHNFDAYIVGGFVRDQKLGIESNDIDLTSSATPEEVSKIFETIPSGIKFGTVLIKYKDNVFEHTTFRLDGSYHDSRHPEEIKFSRNILDDLKRRDFTINSFLFNKDMEFIDYLNAKKDLDNKIIKTIGNPNDRFKEDALRILRAFSFVSKLGFDLDLDTYISIKNNKDLLKNVSIERIRIEFDKISKGAYRLKAWKLFFELKINEVFPDMVMFEDYDISFRDILINSLLKNGKISDFWQLSKQELRYLDKCANLLKLGVTDYNLFIAGYIPSTYALEYLKMDVKRFDELDIKSLKDLNIDGYDLKDISKEKRGECLNYLAKMVLEKKIKNEKNLLLKEAIKWNTSE